MREIKPLKIAYKWIFLESFDAMVTNFRHHLLLVEVSEGDDRGLDGNHFAGKNVIDGHQEAAAFRVVRHFRLLGETVVFRIRIFENNFRRFFRF